jgi:hypothetical protein
MVDRSEEVEVLVENEISPKAQPTSCEPNLKKKDKQRKKKEYLNLSGCKN